MTIFYYYYIISNNNNIHKIMKNIYSTQKNNKKNRRRGNIKTRSIQRGGVMSPRNSKPYASRGNYNNHGYRGDSIITDNSSFGIDLSGLKSALLSQLKGVLEQSEEEDIPHEKKDEIVDYIKNSDYIRELRRSFHNPTELQKGMQDFIDGIEAKILEYPEKWQASRLEKKNVLDANGLLQSSINNFSSAVKEGKEMSMGKLQQLWSVVNSAKDCMGGSMHSSANESEGGKTDHPTGSEAGKPGNVVPKPTEPAKHAKSAAPVLPNNETGLDKSKGAPAVASELETKMGSMFETKQSGGKVNVHEHPRRYIKEIKDNRKKLYEKEMEIIRSIRNFNNSHTRTHNHLHNSNKYHTRKFRRAIMK
jgi:hypothetical protein